ncbi:MAG: NHL repeat-containing protein [Candidatus Krumholzibacteriales bacterium]
MRKLHRLILLLIFVPAAVHAAVQEEEPAAGDYPNIVEADSVLAGLKEPLGISAGARGGIYVADGMSGKLFKYMAGREVLEFPVPRSLVSIYPVDVAAGADPFIYVLDYSSGNVLRYDYRGGYLDVLISFDDFKPSSISAGAGGSFILTDMENHSVLVLNPLLDREVEIEGYGWEAGFFNKPAKAVILRDGRLAVADTGNRRVQIFSSSGLYLRQLSPPDSLGFKSPRSLCCGPEGNIFVADTGRGSVFAYSPGGEYITAIDSYSGKKISPSALTVDLNDNLFVADLLSRSILIYRLVYPDNER